MNIKAFAIACLFSVAAAQEDELPCQKFEDIYEDGTDLCQKMWGDAFIVQDDYNQPAYSFWFLGDNPNSKLEVDPITGVRKTIDLQSNGTEIETCHLDYFHKDHAPTPEADTFTECHPWKENACCNETYVESPKVINEGYGAEYHWDRCGAMSPACERFFVAEACFYECEPSAGLYRRFPDEDAAHSHDRDHLDADQDGKVSLAECETAFSESQCDDLDRDSDGFIDDENEMEFDGTDGTNRWEIYKMPIRKDHCDAFFDACRHDSFCSAGGGNFWECAKIPPYTEPEVTVVVEKEVTETEKIIETLGVGAIVGIIIACVAAIGCSIFVCCLITKERSGSPYFEPILQTGETASTTATP